MTSFMDDPFVNKIQGHFTLQERLLPADEVDGPDEADGSADDEVDAPDGSVLLRMLETLVRLLCRTKYSCSSSAKLKITGFNEMLKVKRYL